MRHYATSRKVAVSSPGEVDSFQPHYDHRFDPACNRNVYQESSCGVKGGRRIRLTTLPPFVS
jgi:hypothetical protein